MRVSFAGLAHILEYRSTMDVGFPSCQPVGVIQLSLDSQQPCTGSAMDGSHGQVANVA